MKEDILTEVLIVLNEAYEADPVAMHSIICNRVPCNSDLANHPTIQVQGLLASEKNKKMYFNVGFIGLLNGIVEKLTGKRIAIKVSQSNDKYVLFQGFQEYDSTS